MSSRSAGSATANVATGTLRNFSCNSAIRPACENPSGRFPKSSYITNIVTTLDSFAESSAA